MLDLRLRYKKSFGFLVGGMSDCVNVVGALVALSAGQCV